MSPSAAGEQADGDRRRRPRRPAATVIGTRNRFQCSQAAPAAIAAGWPSTTAPHARSLSSKTFGPMREHQREAGGREDAADESEQQQDRGQRHSALGGEEQRQAPGRGGDEQRRQRATGRRLRSTSPSDWPIDWPIQPTANSRIAAAIETKMSLKPVIRRNCSSSTAGDARCWSTKARKALAASALSAPDATASSRSFWLYMDMSSLWREPKAGVLLCQYSIALGGSAGARRWGVGLRRRPVSSVYRQR